MLYRENCKLHFFLYSSSFFLLPSVFFCFPSLHSYSGFHFLLFIPILASISSLLFSILPSSFSLFHWRLRIHFCRCHRSHGCYVEYKRHSLVTVVSTYSDRGRKSRSGIATRGGDISSCRDWRADSHFFSNVDRGANVSFCGICSS